MPEKLQIPQSFKALHDAICIHLNSYEDAHRSLLHQQIRKREVVPNRTQVNFSNDLDVLLGEIIRKLS